MRLAKTHEAPTAMPTRVPPLPAARPDLTELAAAKFIERHGSGGLNILEERAELADELGHKIAARTWRTMADAAARLLRTERRGAGLPGLTMSNSAMPPPGPRTPWRR